jgi:hypothetical protein
VVAAAIVGSIASAAAAWGLVSAQTGCTLAGSCDITTVYVTADAGLPPGVIAGTDVAGQLFQAGAGVTDEFGPTVWQSSAIDGTWMNFPGQRSYIIYPLFPDGGPIQGPFIPESVQVSADPSPYPAPSNFAPSSGNITEFSGLPDGGTTGFQVTNNTCSPYFLYLQMAYPRDAGATD